MAGRRRVTGARRVLSTLTAAALSLSLALAPATALASSGGGSGSDLESQLSEAQERLSQANAAYDAANDEVEQLDQQIADAEARVAELEAELPQKRADAARAMRATYRMQQASPGLVELILSSEDFYDLLSTVFYLDAIQGHNLAAIDDLVDATDELTATRDQLEQDRAAAETRRQDALDAVSDAEAARDDLERMAEQEAAAEEEERQKALEEAEQEAEAGETFTNASGEQVAVEVPKADTSSTTTADDSKATDTGSSTTGGSSTGGSTTTPSTPSTPTTPTTDARTTFVSTWTTRIDSYLAGSPLAGYGYAFAEAAWDYGVDPRWSPAIACIESGKGRYCANTCNAWGMTAVGGGWRSWSDWDSAIRSAVAYLSGYGYTISLRAASIYCPPGGAWYSAVSAQMQVVWPTDSL